MAWIESHQALQRHRKTIRAANLLKISRPLLIGHLHCLWWWALDNADPDGRLGRVSDAEIAEAAEWPVRQATRFLDALHDAGFLDVDAEGSVSLHDWYDYAGKLMDRRSANAERMRAARSGRVSLKEVARDPARVEHVQRTFAARAPATQPDPTGPNRTGPEDPPGSPPAEAVAAPAVDSSPSAPPSEPAPPGRLKPAPKPARSGPPLDPLFDAFTAVGLPRPAMLGREPVAAQGLLGHYSAEQLAACWQDYASGDYGNDVDHRNLSFGYLANNNRVGNWLAWRNARRASPKAGPNGTGASPEVLVDRDERSRIGQLILAKTAKQYGLIGPGEDSGNAAD